MKANYKVNSPLSELNAYSFKDAKSIIIYPHSMIIRIDDGEWVNMPICRDAKAATLKANAL